MTRSDRNETPAERPAPPVPAEQAASGLCVVGNCGRPIQDWCAICRRHLCAVHMARGGYCRECARMLGEWWALAPDGA